MSAYYYMHSGKLINPKAITEEDICLEDIAHHLTNISRFGGSLPLNMHYSVAEHSILMCSYALKDYSNIEVARYALMHDAAEAYLGDVVTALKKLLPDYRAIEKDLEQVISKKYRLDSSVASIVKELDLRMLLTEAKYLTPERYEIFRELHPGIEPLEGINITGRDGKKGTKNWFLFCCQFLNIKD